ncbi:MAG: acetyltransferase [Bacteriovorax sp.]|jgi:acetyltransferase EpsM
MKTAIVLFGGGGHAKVIADIVLAEGKYEIVGLYDAKLAPGDYWNDVYKIVSFEDALKIGKGIVSIGDNFDRQNLAKEIVLKNSQFEFVTTIHPSAVVGRHVKIGNGTVVMPQVVINSSASLGCHLVVNTSAVIEHDCILGDFVFISPGVVMGGNVKIEEMSMIGMNASIKHSLHIGSNTIIGMGACVIRDAKENSLYVNRGGIATNINMRKIGDRFFK